MEYNQELKPGRPKPVLCWGHKHMPNQQGIVTYGIAPNRMRAGTLFWTQGAIFNIFRRSRNQFLYVVPPFVAAYLIMDWANNRNGYLNSKKGRAEYAEEG